MKTNLLDFDTKCGVADVSFMMSALSTDFKCSVKWEKSIQFCNLLPCVHSSNHHNGFPQTLEILTLSPPPPPPVHSLTPPLHPTLSALTYPPSLYKPTHPHLFLKISCHLLHNSPIPDQQ